MQKGVEDVVGDGYEKDDEEGIEELHLVGVDGEEVEVAVHLSRLDGPRGALLVKPHEEDPRRQHHYEDSPQLDDFVQKVLLKQQQKLFTNALPLI